VPWMSLARPNGRAKPWREPPVPWRRQPELRLAGLSLSSLTAAGYARLRLWGYAGLGGSGSTTRILPAAETPSRHWKKACPRSCE